MRLMSVALFDEFKPVRYFVVKILQMASLFSLLNFSIYLLSCMHWAFFGHRYYFFQ